MSIVQRGSPLACLSPLNLVSRLPCRDRNQAPVGLVSEARLSRISVLRTEHRNSYADPLFLTAAASLTRPYKDSFRRFQLAVDQSSPQSFSVSAMARFFAVLLAAAAAFQVGSAAPYSFPNGTVPAAPPVPTASGSPNGTAVIANEVLKRRLRDFPIALHRP
ncbi:hypothetical protein F4805DRAFT_457145 [Annulohypoxylon moriforme]|nr:hypothetical protein F4805DRAFT_457145 [Annulohypoxylon moriforme]